ncbi:hypothetical protein BGZ60DRAFT_540731 [Tricladium varicosporioides]|nr:hypothetical protein BGZ60DRAFT_540731 [Hymenoscyphus varicosporioides]
MGEYTEPTAFEIHTEQSPIVQNETKVRPCYFPLLTNGVIIDSDMSRKGTKNTYHVTPINLGRLSNSDSLRAFCDKHTLQIPTLFQLAWSVVLSSYIGTENVGFVVVKSRKDRHEIGFCEVELKNENAIIGFLKEVEKNVEESSSTYNRIPSAGFQIPITSEGSHAFNSVVLFQERDGELSNYFINIAVRETALQVEVELSYPSTFLPQAHAKNVASTFSQALLEIVQQPQQSIREMDLVSPTHLSQIWEWNKEMPKPVAKRVNDLIEAQARRRPQAQAIVAEDGDLTYGMLSDLSTKLAHHLISLGIGLEYVVPLCFEKSKWAIVAMLAVVKAGAAIVNLDAGQPMARLTGLLDQMNATMILSSRRNAELWQDRMMTLIVDEDNIAQLAQHAEPPVTNATPQNTLYVIFTSGSTGTPKGCVIEHESFLTAAAEHIKASKMTEDSRLFQGTPYTFDVSMLEIFTALSTGACVCSCGDELMKTGLANVINTLRITWTFMTPSLVRLIEPAEVPSLKTLALGGEALSATDVRVWADRLHLCNGYGPTETSVAAALNPGITRDTDPLNIGRGAGALCWVVKADDHHSLVPIGAVGELIIQGPIVARGYFQNPEKTREVFINQLPAFASKLAGLSPARLYKTGDLVRLNSDGTIAFIGRKDKQVKLRGQRLELGEIEHHINLNSHVRHGLVVLPKSGHCSERLVAVMSLHDFPSTSTNTADINLIKPEYKAKSHIIAIEVRESIRPQLTTYMLPTVWVVLESLPLTTSGKINGRAVSSWLENISKEVYNEIAGVTELKGDENPTSEMEKIMQNVWSEVLNIPASEIGLSRSFISIGGDSITAMKVVTRLRLRNILLAAKDIFQSKSLSEVATRAKISETSLVQAEDHDRPAELSTAQRIATVGNDLLSKIGLSSISQVEDVFICSPMQESIVLTRARFPGTYEIQKVIMLESQDPSMLKTQHIQSAWQKVVDRHQSLRSIIVTALKGISGNAVYHQIILKHFNADVVETKFDGEATPSKISAFLRSHAPPAYGNLTPEHRLTICNIDDKKSCIMVDVSHAVVDGLSAETILQDLALALEDRLPSGKGPLYGDYISHIQRMPEAESIAHWKHVLASSQPTIVPMYGGDKKSAKKPRSTKVAFSQWAELQQFCAANGVTISNVIQTAWALTLKTYTGSEEVLFGYMASGRDLPVAGIEEAVGVYLTMLVCHLAIDERATISELVQNIQENYMAGHPHQYTPLGKIQNALNMQGSPLFNTIMSLYKPAAHAEGGVITLNAIDEVDPCEFDIAVGAYLTDHNINISLSYWSSTMSDSEAANIARTFSGAISAVLKSASTKVEDLDLFNEHDQAQISKWNSKEPLAVEGLVHEYVKKQVLAQPDAPAVCSWDGDFTYRELDRLSDRLAFYLSYRGVGAEVLVPHCFDKSKWSSVVTFAIMKAGGAGVGLSPSHPVSRLSAIIEDCGSKIILVAPQHAHLFKSVETAVILVDSDYVEKLPGVVAGSRLPKVHASNPAFVSFTSGSTGKPKGIILEHRSLITSIMAHGTEWEIRPGSRVIQFSAYAFDAAVSDTFTTLVKGGCICIPSEHERTNDLIGAINRMNVNWAFLTPRVLGTLSPKTVPTLKTVVLGGEAISSEDVDPWTKDISLRIVYGPTECTIYSMGTDPLTPTSDPTSLGHGIGTRVWVTDSKTHDKLAPVGVIGELLIEGPLVTRGYLNEPEKTKASFIEDPKWMPREVGMLPRRFYKTNDLVRYLPGGDMMFIGRKDTQVKIRGQRVELGEIEHAILQNLDTVLHVSVDSVIFPSTGQTLVAFLYLQCPTMGESTPEKLFLQLDEPMTAVLRQLEKTLIEYLPTYMVPSLFIPIGYVPMTLTAKVDRKLLKLNASKFTTEEFEIYSLASQHKTATTTTTEKQLQHLWAEVLNKDPGTIGANDSFFRLGGDSITAMKLVTAAREVGMIISVADIFQAPELSKMAAILGSLGVGDATEAEAPRPFELLPDVSDLDALLEEISEQYWIPKENIHDVYPCTPLQEALVAISTTQPGAYVAQNVFRLPPDMDLERFKSAWQTMVDIHAIFRTRVISPINTRFLQVILRKSIISWEEASSLEEYLEQDMNRPILYGAELVRYGLVNDEKTGHFSFVWTAHHAVYDGWTIPIVLEQVVQIYKNEPLPTEAPFSHFIKHLEDVNSEASKDFWRSQLSGDLPASFPKLPNPAYQPRSTETMWHKIDVTPKAGSGITLAIVLRAAWAIVVARYADSSDIVYGLTLSGRDMNVPGIHKTLGPTITTVPVKVHVDPQLTVENYLAAIQKQSVDMMAYQHMGLQNIKRVSTEVSEASDFKNLFCVQPESDDQGDFLGMELMPSNTVGFDTYALLVECNFKGGRVAIKASFDSEVIPSDQINRLLYQFEKVVMQVNGQSATTILEQIDLFSEQDRQQVWDWNSVSPMMNDECVTKLVRQQVLRRPNAIAVDSWDGSLTYRALDDLSSRMAYFLRHTMGVKPEVLVPMCFDKSVWTVVAIVSVVKAGGAYVMLNPEHPISRIRDLLEDVNSHLLLTAPEHQHLFDLLPQTATPINEAFIKGLPSVSPSQMSQIRVQPHHPAAMIFTSGSTGKPKGILLYHNALSTVSTQHGRGLGWGGKNARHLQFANYTFDASVAEIFFTLMHGGTICMISEYERINNLAGAMRDMRITCVFLTPTVAALVDPRDVPDLQTIILGGEQIQRALIDRWSPYVRTINSYGPSECTIWTSHMDAGDNVHSSNIGFGYGSRLWIVEPKDHNRLTPVGCIGELLIEGPIVAQGYLKELEKTKASFIDSPPWMEEGSSGTHRLYKTGDLVRYASNGSLIIVGRKDTQVKFHGQRIELGEIEFHIQEQPEIEIGMVVMPKLGLAKGKLVAVLIIKEFNPLIAEGEAVKLLKPEFKERARDIITEIKLRLADKLPPYMIPSTWMVLNSIPRTTSGKLNRVPITKWIHEMGKEQYLEINDATRIKNKEPTTSMEKQLMEVVSHVLDIPADNIGANRSFLSLGGDSITAMQVVSRCRAAKIALSVEDILKSKSLVEMATRAKLSSGPSVSKEEEFDVPFELSPVQQLYFKDIVPLDASLKCGIQYNQNVLARFTRRVREPDVSRAITEIVKLHSMLRTTFGQNANGKWMQTVRQGTTKSHVFESHNATTREQMMKLVNKRQSGMDIRKGPLFGVDLFNMKDGCQLISLCAHHLVIDLVSWRVILQNLEELLESKKPNIETPLPFQTWNRLQIMQAQTFKPAESLPAKVPAANFSYWNMSSPPTWKNVDEVSFILKEEATSQLFGSANDALQTEPVEILLAVLQQSFRQAFKDRDAPAVFCEGHGRETWDSEIDPSTTVGWFTTFSPIYVSGSSKPETLDLVRRTKDVRRKIPKNGWKYFNCRHFSPEGIEAFRHHSNMEICFNYMGRYQQLEREGALIRQEALQEGEAISFVGEATRRLAIFDVSAVVTNRKLHFSFFFNRGTSHMAKIRDWINKCEELIYSMVQDLIKAPKQHTLSDFPLVSMDYEGLSEFSSTLKEIGIANSNIEDLYPASAVQEGILISQARSPSTYKVRQMYKILSNDQSLPINVARIRAAWQQVVDYHAVFRTIFLDTFDGSGVGLYDQLVLKEFPADVKLLQFDGEGLDVVAFLEDQPSPVYTDKLPPHRVTLCEAKDGIYMHWEISHSLIDGASLAVVMKDFTLAYEGLLPSGKGPLYSDFIRYLQRQPESASLEYWAGYLADIEPCFFPRLREGPTMAKSSEPKSIVVNLDIECDLQKFCENHELTVGNLIQAAWGLVLKLYTGSNKVCFGHMTSGRDVPLDNVYDAVGPYINLLVCNMDFSEDIAVDKLLFNLQHDYLESFPHQHTALGKIQKVLGNQGIKLFNTFINLQRSNPAGPEPRISLDVVGQMDPTDYDLSLYITTGGPDVELVLTYLESYIPEDRAVNIVNTFSTILKCLLSHYDSSVGSLDFVSQQDKEQIKVWNHATPRQLNGQRIELNEIEGLIASILSGSQQVAVEVVTVSARQNKKILIAFFSGNTAIVKNTSVQESILSLSEDLQKFFTTVKAEIGRLLPQYMMPNLFVPLSSLPLTSSLKLNRPALQDLGKILGEEELSRYSLAEAAKKKTALSAKGKVLSAIWARVLGIPVKSIGVNDHFFRLGGDSISAMKVVTVSRTEGFSLTVADIFQTPTLSAMCKALKKLGQATESSMIGSDTLDAFSLIDEIVDIEPLAKEAAKLCGVDSTLIEDMYPCTPAQEILMAVPGQTMITNVSQNAYEIPSSLDLARFQRAWETLFVSSPILRTRIISTTQGVFQVVLKEELSWQNCLSLEQYLEESTEVQITYGTPLIRFAIVGRSKKTIVWTAHNAIYDATTTSIIVEQIASIYERDTVLDVIAYNQFVRSLTKIDADSVVTFWREQLAQESSTYPALPYAAYEPRTNMKTIGTLHASRTDPEVPLTMVLRAAWAIVLSVYADTNDVIFGATSPGCYANVGESMAVMGPTSSTVPVQISLNHSKTIPEYLRQVNRQYTAMIPFQHTGLDNIRQINKEASNAFYLQNLFIVHPSSDKSEFMGMAPVNLKMNHAHPYGLVIECNLNASIVEVQVMYDSNLLQIEQADRIIHQFKHVANQLNAVDMNSSMKLEDVEIFTSQDLQQIVEWNTARPEMIETCVHTLFEEQACKRPNASAVEGFDGNFTYAQLNDMATRLSQFLVSRGVKREDKIPVCYNKSTWVIVAMFGIMKSGGTCVMLNPDNPVERVRGIIEDLDCKMVLCDSPSSKIFTTLLPSSGIILMDESFLRTLPLREMAPIAVQPSNAVLVVYTSGSTGKPKGIVLEHQSIATGLLAHGIQMGIGMHTRTFQFAAYTFDVSLEEIITTLILGGTVCVPSEFDRMNDIAGAMARMRVNWTELTPTVASLLDPSMVPTLKTLALSGESVTKEVVEIWADYVQMVNTYGPSECSVSTSCNIHLAKFRDISNIGQGFGCKLWVVDPRDHNKLAPIGGVGELLVEGPIVAREYWNDVEKTTAAFVYDLAWAKDMPGNPRKFYKTGDLVKYNPDSSIKFIGRRDTQVKLHGQRIEMGEIEYQVKAALPGSSYQVAVEVLTPESRGKNKMLAAFFCKGNSTAIGTDFILPATVSKDMLAELMSKLELSLPAYMVPTIFVPLGFMPLSTSGKLDRKTIRQVANKLSYDDLASYSLSVVKLLAKEVATSGSVTAMERGLKPFTLLSKQVDVLALRNEAARQCGVTEEWIQDIYPCTPLQEGLMVRTAQRENAYVSQTIYRLPDGIDLEKFQIAGNYIRNTQSILRTRIIYTGTQALQVVVAEAEEWHSAPTLEAYKKWDKETPMTYGAPLVRYGLVNGRATGSETFFIYTAHHSVYDGWSDALLVGAFEAAYTHGVEILPKATQYNQFIQFLEKIDLAASNKFWQHQLSGAVPTSFPQLLSPDFEPNPDKQQTIRLDIPARSGSAFTLTTVLKAAWSIVLGHTTDSSDVIFDHVLSGRNAPVEDIDGMIGPTICTVPLRVQFDRNTKAQQFLSDIQMQSIEMMPFEQAGIQNILRLPGVNATARSGNLLVVQPKMTGDTGPLGMKIVSKTPDDFETYALIVECHISDSSPTEVVVRFDERVVSEGEVSWMLTHFEAAARNLLLQPSSSLNELSLFGKKDIDQLIEWAGAPIPVKEACVHDLFQAQAGLQPFKQAIHAWDGDLTYSQLESQSQLIANHLQSIGVTQNSFVPLCFSKSIWAIISMIAVLKCGAAIVMLNPEYPAERLNEIVSQVEAKVILAGTNELSTVQDLAKTVLAVNADMVAELRPILVAKKLVVSPKSPVYVVFTSGSTGKPKGVVIEHQAFVTSAAYHAPMCKLDSNSRVLQFAAYTFDISMADIFTTLIVGGTICVLSDTDRTGDLAGAINRLDANWACLTATVAGLFGPSDVPNFKTLTLAGEAPTEGNVSTWGGKVNLVNAYGPSEASVYCCIQKEMTSAKSHLNCGTGSGLRLWITEPENPQKLVPVGSIGEMLIEGPTLARGYLGDAVKTAAAFIENPAWMNQYAQIGGARRLYRTGDMAKYNFDGTVEFCGRRDNQVKINGQRLETQEIEHHIRSRLSHLDVAVDAISLTAQGNRKILVAFFYPRDSVSGEWTADDIGLSFSSAMQNVFVELRSDLFRSIPSFMIPSLFIPLKGMPINTSFKLNRLVLRQLVNSLDEKSFRDFSLADVKKKAPSTQTEKQLASLWAEVLGTSKDAIGVTDNFFQLGGDSLVAMKLSSRLREAGITMTLANIFKNPRIVDAAAFLNDKPSSASHDLIAEAAPYKRFSTIENANMDAFLLAVSEKAGVQRNNIIDVLPTTTSQDIALVGILTDSRWMLNYYSFQGNGAVDLQRVQRACFELVQSLEILRTVFVLHEARFFQVVLKSLTPMFSVYETDQDIDAFAKGLYEDSFSRDIPLEDPFVQFVVIKQLHTLKHRIIMRLSHAQYDGASLPGIWQALKIAFEGQAIPETPGFARYASRSHALALEAASRDHWTQLLAGSSMTNIISRQAPELRKTSEKVTILSKTIRPQQLTTEAITFATIIKAAWSMTLAQLASKVDVVFGHTVNGRNLPVEGVENIVGPCLNIIPVRVTMQRNWKIIDLLNFIQSQQLNNLPFESIGYRDIVKNCTNWPTWTHFSSVVQHQSFEANEPTINLGGTSYTPGYMGTDLDMVDVSVLSSALDDNSTEISLMCSPTIPVEFAEELLEIVCKNTMSFTANPYSLLPMASTTMQAIPLSPGSPGSVASSRSFETLSKKDTAALVAVLQRTWSKVLRNAEEIRAESSIFELGGDVINVAQVAYLLREKSFEVSVEDLVRFPTLEGQVELLSTQARKARQILG